MPDRRTAPLVASSSAATIDPAPTPPDAIPRTSTPFVHLVDLPRVDGLAGVAMLVLVLNGLGLQIPGAHLAADVVLTVMGFQIGLGVRRLAGTEHWTSRYVSLSLAPIMAPTMVAVALAVAHWWWAGRLDEAGSRAAIAALAGVSNLLPVLTDAPFAPTQHLWLVALIAQAAMLAPLTAALARRPGGGRRVVRTMIVLASAVALARFAATAAGLDPTAVAQLTPTRADGLLLGLAVALAPRALVRTVPSTLAGPVLVLLVAILTFSPAPAEHPVMALGVLPTLVTVAAAGVLATMNAYHRPSRTAAILGRLGPRWLGERAISIWVWHQLFGMALDAPLGGVFGADWPGPMVFLTRLVFALAAGAASYRYLQLPFRAGGGRSNQQPRPLAASARGASLAVPPHGETGGLSRDPVFTSSPT